jgi:hypothetical protein
VRQAEADAVREFLETSVVSALLIGGDRPTALVDSKIVRLGDRLAGGLLEVARIDAQGVHYNFRETTVLQGLPAFIASGVANVEQGEDELEGPEDSAPVAGDPGDDPAASTESTNVPGGSF